MTTTANDTATVTVADQSEADAKSKGGHMSERMLCPSCGGKKQTLCHVDGVRDGKRFGETRLMPCSTCDGAGEITLEHHERIIVGECRRNDRKARCVTLREEAKRLGISPMELSDIEWGRSLGQPREETR